MFFNKFIEAEAEQKHLKGQLQMVTQELDAAKQDAKKYQEMKQQMEEFTKKYQEMEKIYTNREKLYNTLKSQCNNKLITSLTV